MGRSRANACNPWSKTGATVWSRYWRVGNALGSARVAGVEAAFAFLAGGGCCCALLAADAVAAVTTGVPDPALALEVELLAIVAVGAAAVPAEVVVDSVLLLVAATATLVSLAASAAGVGFVGVAGESALASIVSTICTFIKQYFLLASQEVVIWFAVLGRVVSFRSE